MKHCKSSRRTGRRHMRRKKQSFSLFYRSGLLSKEALLAQGETSGDRAWLRTSSVSGRIVGRRRRRNERKREFLSSERKRSEGEFFFAALIFFCVCRSFFKKATSFPRFRFLSHNTRLSKEQPNTRPRCPPSRPLPPPQQQPGAPSAPSSRRGGRQSLPCPPRRGRWRADRWPRLVRCPAAPSPSSRLRLLCAATRLAARSRHRP